MPAITVDNAKNSLSELIAQSSRTHERFILTQQDKPVAALVCLEDLLILENKKSAQGLASIAGKWDDFEEVEQNIQDIRLLRKDTGSRKNVPL